MRIDVTVCFSFVIFCVDGWNSYKCSVVKAIMTNHSGLDIKWSTPN